MEGNLKNSLLLVCRLLEQHGVVYLLIGGTAVGLYGYKRYSSDTEGNQVENPDIDIWYQPTYENYFKLLQVIDDLGYDATAFKEEQAPNPRQSFFKLIFEKFTLDLLPLIMADLSFFDAYSRKKLLKLEDTPIYLMDFHDLLEDKKITARKKDLDDLEQLRKSMGKENPDKDNQ